MARKGKAYRYPDLVSSNPGISPEKRQAILNSQEYKMCGVKLPFTEDEAKKVAAQAGVSKGGWQNHNRIQRLIAGVSESRLSISMPPGAR